MNAAPQTLEQAVQTLQEIELARLLPSPTAAQGERRRHFDKEGLEELAASIRKFGVVQAIVVRKRPEESVGGVTVGEHFEIVAGERRWMAAQMAGLERIPAHVREMTDEEVVEIQLIENLHREDLHPMHEAESYDELVRKFGHSVDELHARIGKSRSYVYGRMKLLALNEQCRAAFYEGKITASHALLLARIPARLQNDALATITANEWSYRDAARIVQQRFMLRLEDARFPVEDPDLNGAGPCGTCPKRTGNQPELFGDVKSADVCTDPICFDAKGRAFAQRQVDKARAEGVTVITGKDAIKVVGGRHSVVDWRPLNGYKLVEKPRKGQEVALLVDPETHVVHQVVPDASQSVATKGESANEEKRRRERAKIETEQKFRRELFLRVRAGLPRHEPSLREIAKAIVFAADMAGVEELEKIYRQTEGVKRTLEDLVDDLSDEKLQQLITECQYADELFVSPWGKVRPAKRLLAAAEAQGIDVKALRRELAPKPAKKKAAKKKHAKGKAK